MEYPTSLGSQFVSFKYTDTYSTIIV